MITNFSVKNFKSIKHLELDLGRVNVFIGANGSGKSNILEAFAFLSASESNKIYNEDLIRKGVRVAKPSLTTSAFAGSKEEHKLHFSIKIAESISDFSIIPEENDNIHTVWRSERDLDALNTQAEALNMLLKMSTDTENSTVEKQIMFAWLQQSILKMQPMLQSIKLNKDNIFDDSLKQIINPLKVESAVSKEINLLNYLHDFVIYQPNTPALRGMTNESHKEPLGIFGENLDVLISNFSKEEQEILNKYKKLVLWLEDFFIDESNNLKLKGYKLNRSLSKLYFVDKFMRKKDLNNVFSAENSNEGVLHLLFYIALLISKRTPQFFAVDNIESSLNPHLCTHLMRTICQIANEEQTKQMLITTHNPAILDGLNLNDDNVRLFAVSRNDKGHTVAQRIKTKPNNSDLKLSELWMRGILGAIDTSF